MKTGLTTSLILHTVVIGFGLISLSSPRKMEVADVESLPVDIIPIEQLTRIQQGDRKAPAIEKPAPKPVDRPDTVENSVNPGDNKVDTKSPPTPETKPREVKTASAPPREPTPVAEKKPETEAKPKAQDKPKPVPATEVKPDPAPKQNVLPDPVQDAATAENPDAETVKLPESAPKPESRPKPPQAQTAKAPERKDSEIPAPKKSSAESSQEKEFDKDEIAALLNREKPAGGGAKKSVSDAALGGERGTDGPKLSQSEMDALRGQIQRCWNITFAGADGADTLKVSIKMRLDRSGDIEGDPEVVAGGGQGALRRIASEAARRAVLRCAPYNLPADKYESWSEVLVHFDPSDMF